MKLLNRLLSFTKWKLVIWLIAIFVLGVVVSTAIWQGRGVSIEAKGINISVSPNAHAGRRTETFGPGSPVVSDERGDAKAEVTIQSPLQNEIQQSNAEFVTHGAGSPVVTGKDAHASVTVHEQ